MTLLLAQSAFASSVLWWLIIAVAIIGAVAIVLVLAKHFGLEIPAWFTTIAWIVLAVVVGILAIKFIASLL